MLAPLIFAAALVLQAPPPTTVTVHPYALALNYDRIRDLSGYSLKLGEVTTSGRTQIKGDLMVMVGWGGQKRKALPGDTPVGLQFLTDANPREFKKSHDMIVLADSKRFRLETERDDRADAPGEPESILGMTSVADLRIISQAEHVEIAVGDRDFSLDSQQIAALKDLSDRLAVTSEEADRIDGEHLVLVRKRRQEMQEALDQAVEQARKQLKSLPPSRRTAQALSSKTLDAFLPTSMKYRPTAEETIELLKAYPEFNGPAEPSKNSRR